MPNASPRPGLLLGLIRARARCSRVVPVSVVPCSPALPISGGDGGPTYLRGGGFLPSRKCLGTSSPPTPLKGYTFTLFHRHPCRHGRPSIRLQTIHVHYRERLVPFPTHDNSSSIKHLGDECWAEPRVLPAGPAGLGTALLPSPHRSRRCRGTTVCPLKGSPVSAHWSGRFSIDQKPRGSGPSIRTQSPLSLVRIRGLPAP